MKQWYALYVSLYSYIHIWPVRTSLKYVCDSTYLACTSLKWEMSSFWRNFRHWLHRKLSKMSNITETRTSSLWKNFRHWLHWKVFQCSQWWNFLQNDEIPASVICKITNIPKWEMNAESFSHPHPRSASPVWIWYQDSLQDSSSPGCTVRDNACK